MPELYILKGTDLLEFPVFLSLIYTYFFSELNFTSSFHLK